MDRGDRVAGPAAGDVGDRVPGVGDDFVEFEAALVDSGPDCGGFELAAQARFDPYQDRPPGGGVAGVDGVEESVEELAFGGVIGIGGGGGGELWVMLPPPGVDLAPLGTGGAGLPLGVDEVVQVAGVSVRTREWHEGLPVSVVLPQRQGDLLLGLSWTYRWS